MPLLLLTGHQPCLHSSVSAQHLTTESWPRFLACSKPHHAVRLAPGLDPAAVCKKLQGLDVAVRTCMPVIVGKARADPPALCKRLQGLDVAVRTCMAQCAFNWPCFGLASLAPSSSDCHNTATCCLPQAQPSRYLPREFITVQQNMQGLLASGLIGSGQGQVQVSQCMGPALQRCVCAPCLARLRCVASKVCTRGTCRSKCQCSRWRLLVCGAPASPAAACFVQLTKPCLFAPALLCLAGRGCWPGGCAAAAPTGRRCAGCLCRSGRQDAVLCGAHAGKGGGMKVGMQGWLCCSARWAKVQLRGFEGLARQRAFPRSFHGFPGNAAALLHLLDASTASAFARLKQICPSCPRPQGQGSVLALDIGRSRLAALRRMAGRQQHGRIVSTRAADLREFAEMLARRRRLAATGGEEAQQAQQEAEQEADQEAQQAQQAQQGPSEASAAAGDDAADSGRKPWPTQFDRVLLDAPCSGTGVLAKRADLRWRRTPEQIEHMVSLQGELLAAAASELIVWGLKAGASLERGVRGVCVGCTGRGRRG